MNVAGEPLIGARGDTSEAPSNGHSGANRPSSRELPVDIDQWAVATHAELQDLIENLTQLQRSRAAHLRSRLATPASGAGPRHQKQQQVQVDSPTGEGEGEGRFFDTELLLLAEHNGMRI